MSYGTQGMFGGPAVGSMFGRRRPAPPMLPPIGGMGMQPPAMQPQMPMMPRISLPTPPPRVEPLPLPEETTPQWQGYQDRRAGEGALLAAALGAIFGGAQGGAMASQGYLGGAREASEGRRQAAVQRYQMQARDQATRMQSAQDDFSNRVALANMGLTEAKTIAGLNADAIAAQAKARGEVLDYLKSVAPGDEPNAIAALEATGTLARAGLSRSQVAGLRAPAPRPSYADTPAGIDSAVSREQALGPVQAKNAALTTTATRAAAEPFDRRKDDAAFMRERVTKNLEMWSKIAYSPIDANIPPDMREEALLAIQEIQKYAAQNGIPLAGMFEVGDAFRTAPQLNPKDAFDQRMAERRQRETERSNRAQEGQGYQRIGISRGNLSLAQQREARAAAGGEGGLPKPMTPAQRATQERLIRTDISALDKSIAEVRQEIAGFDMVMNKRGAKPEQVSAYKAMRQASENRLTLLSAQREQKRQMLINLRGGRR